MESLERYLLFQTSRDWRPGDNFLSDLFLFLNVLNPGSDLNAVCFLQSNIGQFTRINLIFFEREYISCRSNFHEQAEMCGLKLNKHKYAINDDYLTVQEYAGEGGKFVLRCICVGMAPLSIPTYKKKVYDRIFKAKARNSFREIINVYVFQEEDSLSNESYSLEKNKSFTLMLVDLIAKDYTCAAKMVLVPTNIFNGVTSVFDVHVLTQDTNEVGVQANQTSSHYDSIAKSQRLFELNCGILCLSKLHFDVDFIVRVSAASRRNFAGRLSPPTLHSLDYSSLPNQLQTFGMQFDSFYSKVISAQDGISVFEFFSGIGGMRLALPSQIADIPIRRVTAFDCSDNPNSVYKFNFELNDRDGFETHLLPVLINGLTLGEVDGKADVWTMSPPCQPFTTTKHARQLDSEDNRCRGFTHLMQLLLHMKLRPTWIVLENVHGFLQSDVLKVWKRVVKACGYRWHQYLLSPISSVGIPNNRLRYYMTAKRLAHNEFDVAKIEQGEFRAEDANPKHWEEHVQESFSTQFISKYPSFPLPLEAYILSASLLGSTEKLLVSKKVLSSSWAPSRLSIVGQHDRTSYCFTRSYSQTMDKSSGSLFLENAEGPLSEAQYAVDRNNLSTLYGQVRLFHPDELLKLFGFPSWFSFPPNMPLHIKYACIGNSVNVTVVRAVMDCCFGCYWDG